MEIKAQINAIAQSKKGAVQDTSKTPTVTEEDIAQIVAAWTSIPVNKLTKSESEKASSNGRNITQPYYWSR